MYYVYEIPLAPVGKKNSQQILYNKTTHKPFIAPPKRYTEYAKQTRKILAQQRLPQEPITYPVNICVRFFMPTRRPVDTVNLKQALWDILVEAGILADDCRDIVASEDGSGTFYDKEHPRTEIVITPYEEEYEQWRDWNDC